MTKSTILIAVQYGMNETMNMQKCEKLWLQILSGKNQFPPGLDGLQPKSPASPGGNKLTINPKILKVFFCKSPFWDKSISSWTR